MIPFEMILFQVTFRPRPNEYNFTDQYKLHIKFHDIVIQPASFQK